MNIPQDTLRCGVGVKSYSQNAVCLLQSATQGAEAGEPGRTARSDGVTVRPECKYTVIDAQLIVHPPPCIALPAGLPPHMTPAGSKACMDTFRVHSLVCPTRTRPWELAHVDGRRSQPLAALLSTSRHGQIESCCSSLVLMPLRA